MKITAAVVHERSGPFTIEELDLCDPRADELLVEVVASGMCATDLHGRDAYYPTKFPKVFGHEGAGIVRAIGSAVTKIKPGDHVLMAYPWCGECPNCRSHRQSYCLHAFDLKMNGTRADGSVLHSKNGKPVYSAFFQQSSFGNFTIANERFAVKVRNEAPIEHVCALACGGQTGAGAVLNVMKPRAGDSFVVFGIGTVGLSGLMAAKICGCDPIIAVDVHEHRLKLARELGATHTINHNSRGDVVAEIKSITGVGARYTLETSALPAVFREAVEALMPAGMCVLLGSARKGTEVSLEMPFVQNGREVRGVIQGDSVPQEFIPVLVDHILAGCFPVDRLITFYELADINRAATESASGKTIKPVLRMPH
ncbi:MAG TPA: NAD(P)-dependent alcohol dehydrogenase [Pseudolabrys sp.]|nr:NAD(P)-dependent alcohol dehydrogenase [Pseudolabrys sp.]